METQAFPDLGGMVAALSVDGRDVLVRDEGSTTDPACRAGGIPLLFPFAGRTGGDSFEIYGARYHMPKHDFAKNRVFFVKEQSKHAVTLCANEDEVLLRECYPYHHTLELSYRMARGGLWYPYFRASNRDRLEFVHHMTVHYDYSIRKEGEAPGSIRPKQDCDDMFYNSLLSEYSLVNLSDGHAVCRIPSTKC
jgi:galactose mutarotase-like enzyme